MKKILFLCLALLFTCGWNWWKTKAVYEGVYGVDQILINKLFDHPRIKKCTLLKVELENKISETRVDYRLTVKDQHGIIIKSWIVQCLNTREIRTGRPIRSASLYAPPISEVGNAIEAERSRDVSDDEWKAFLKVRR